jgi:hypothetical protein
VKASIQPETIGRHDHRQRDLKKVRTGGAKVERGFLKTSGRR